MKHQTIEQYRQTEAALLRAGYIAKRGTAFTTTFENVGGMRHLPYWLTVHHVALNFKG